MIMRGDWKGPYSRRLARKASERGRRLAKIRWAKWRAEAHNRPESEPRMERYYPFEFGVRRKGNGETHWHDLVSVRHAAKALGLILKFCVCLLLAAPCFGQSEKQLWALSQIETGMNPDAVGRAGEVTEYQTTPCVLQEFKIPLSATLTRSGAKNACKVIWGRRIDHFRATHHREPTDYEIGLLWHCPAAVGHPNAEQDDFAQRFANLCERKPCP